MVQYCGGIKSVVCEDTILHCGGNHHLQWRMLRTTEVIPTERWRDTISAEEDIQCCVGIPSVVWGYHQYSWGYDSVHWRIFSTVEGYYQ